MSNKKIDNKNKIDCLITKWHFEGKLWVKVTLRKSETPLDLPQNMRPSKECHIRAFDIINGSSKATTYHPKDIVHREASKWLQGGIKNDLRS